MAKETVLVVGATGNIGVSVISASLRSGRDVLAIVRNQESAKKLFDRVGTKDGIITVEADVTAEDGVQSVVDQVKAGKLPAFQHVYATVGMAIMTSPIQNVSISDFRMMMNVAVESNFFAYHATIPYLVEQGDESSTWTLMTGAAGTFGSMGVTAISQGALFTMANVACRENAKTNIRFNEVYLAMRVEHDASAKESGAIPSSDFGRHYAELLKRTDINACRVSIMKREDIDDLKFAKKLG